MQIVVITVEVSPGIHKAHCPALPGCVVLAESREEALERLSNAVVGYFASLDATVPEKFEWVIREQEAYAAEVILQSSLGAFRSRSAASSFKSPAALKQGRKGEADL
jgi:predicted RNase H-like HicB family nuclease